MREPVQVIADIIEQELGLPEGQVMLGNQRREIPTVGLYVVVYEPEPSTTIGACSDTVAVGNGMVERQSATIQHRVRIDLMAFNDEKGGNAARERKEEVLLALASNRSQELQIENSMQIARNGGPITDLSALEGPAMLSRFVITVAVTAVHIKEKPAEYFDNFPRKETINV